MPLRSFLLLGLAVLLAGATALGARSLLTQPAEPQQQQTAPEPEPKTRVLVASETLGMGRLVNPGDLSWQAWPEERLHDDYLRKGAVEPADFDGHVVRYAISAGEPVTRHKLVAPGRRGFLAAALTPGMRAVSVKIDEVSGVSGFIFPGDRVDLLLNHGVSPGNGNQRQVSETVVGNLRVLAVDTRTQSPGADGNGERADPQMAKTVTLEVTPKIAEKIALAKRLGEISLSLRSMAETESQGAAPRDAGDEPPNDDVVSYTWDTEVSKLLPPVNPDKEKTEVTLSRGSKVSTKEFPEDSGS